MKRKQMHAHTSDRVSKLSKRIALNVLSAVITGFLLWECYHTFPTYAWVYNTLLKSNYKFASANRHLTADQRREIKLDFDFRYLDFLKKSTPGNAVIWMPGRATYFPENTESPFSKNITSKLYRLRVLYPRKIVDAEETNNKYAAQITHVAIVNGVGYDKLDYTPEKEFPFAVFPIKMTDK